MAIYGSMLVAGVLTPILSILLILSKTSSVLVPEVPPP